MIIAPSRIRPNQVINVYISVFKLRFPVLNVRTAVRRDGEEVAAALEEFHTESTRLTQIRVWGTDSTSLISALEKNS